MKIIVCTKFVQGELNPFDAVALECALEWAENVENVRVTVLGMGPKTWTEPMSRLTRLGKNGSLRAVLLSDPAFAGSDTLATSRILAEAIRKLMVEDAENRESVWVFCGRQTIDGDTAQVGPELAAILGFNLATNCMEMPGKTQIKTRLGMETVTAPAVLTLERIRELRFPSLRSRPGTVEVWDREKLGIPVELCGQAGSPTRVLKTFTAEHGRRKCRWISWEELPKIVEEKRKETMVVTQNETEEVSEKPRFACIHVVGREVEAQARAVGERVIFVEKMAPREIADAVKDAEVVLWNADLWGRRMAPQVAALLGTGLCADCTALETDGKTLFMYRPARSGDILAKIECRTRPQMATVRTTGESADVILAGGRGVADCWSEMLALAEKLNAEPAASRALVDTGKAPYEFQIGLTGKSVSPKVYIAVGISGAVQHTCAMETAGTVIAINPDKDARIFEYADYGILGKFPQ